MNGLKNAFHQASFYMYFMFLLFLNSRMSPSFACSRPCKISFLNSFSLISFNLASRSLSFRIISFFSSSTLRLPYSMSTLFIFSCQDFSMSLYSDYSFRISSSIYDIMSIVTTCWLPFFIFSLFSRMRSSTSFIFLFFPTIF